MSDGESPKVGVENLLQRTQVSRHALRDLLARESIPGKRAKAERVQAGAVVCRLAH